MQDNIAYNTIELSNMASCENVYEIPEASKTDMKKVEPVNYSLKKRMFKVRCFDLIFVSAIVLAAIAVVLSSIGLANNYNQEQMFKANIQELNKKLNQTIDTFELALSALHKNISNELFRPSLTTNSSTTEPVTTITPTTLPTELCGGPGWRRVAFINMTDPNQDCPQGLNLTDYPIRSCGRTHTQAHDCSSVVFLINGSQYSQVCGRVTAYRWGDNFGFAGYHLNRLAINSAYVDGLSLTHGLPPTHIWTFASGFFSGNGSDAAPYYRCPCDPGNNYTSPSFVENDYFCDSVAKVDNDLRFYPDNVLWDGQDLLNPCYGLNNPPWFNTTLPVPTAEDIELRMCFFSDVSASNIAITILEIFVY